MKMKGIVGVGLQQGFDDQGLGYNLVLPRGKRSQHGINKAFRRFGVEKKGRWMLCSGLARPQSIKYVHAGSAESLHAEQAGFQPARLVRVWEP